MQRFFQPAVKGTQAVGYGVTTVVAGTATTAFAVTTAALACTGILVPLAFLTGGVTYALAECTINSGLAAAHKGHRAVLDDDHERQHVHFSYPWR